MMARLAGWDGTVNADSDCDGDVDLNDFALFADCMAGSGATPTPTLTTVDNCRALFDFDEDTDLDLTDFGDFQVLFTGPA
jgi:hypothetical protein